MINDCKNEQSIKEFNAALNERISKNEKNAEEDNAVLDKRIAKNVEAIGVANDYIADVERIAKEAQQLAELLKAALIDGVTAVDKRITEPEADTDTENVPDSN